MPAPGDQERSRVWWHRRAAALGLLAGLSAVLALGVVLGLQAWWEAAAPAGPGQAAGNAARGGYLLDAGGCVGCHTDTAGKGPRLAGGRALKTPFGTFYTPNITPDPVTGIGRWSDAEFVRALSHGTGPGGRPLFPAFPFPSYTFMTPDDMRDLKAFLMTQPAVVRPNRPHDLSPPFAWRATLVFWKLLFLKEGPLLPDPGKSTAWNRGRYLAEALGHCGECHTPSGPLGDTDRSRWLAGNPQGPEGSKVPALTATPKGLGSWSDADLLLFLDTGLKPDGDATGNTMSEVVRNTTSRLTPEDRQALVAYLRDLPQ